MLSRLICLWGCIVFLASCASTSKPVRLFSQPQVNALVVSGRFEEAAELFKMGQPAYGPKNELLLLLDKGYVLHLAGRYRESMAAFEKAQKKLDELYTRSISNIATTWLVNDNRAPYRGEYFEHTLINIFQALNYAALDDVAGALVEMRAADRKLTVLNDVFRYNKYDIYRDDAFARFLAGILYESRGNRRDTNDAFIAYRNALKIYQDAFHSKTEVEVPRLLIQNLLATAEYLGFEEEFRELRKQFPDIAYSSVEEKLGKAEVYLIHYSGLSPIKHPVNIPVPLPEGYATQFSFPTYEKRHYGITSLVLIATANGRTFEANSEPCVNLERIAEQSLNDRKVQIYTKSGLRPLAKYIVEQGIENKIEKSHGEGAAFAFRGASSIFNLFSEQADLRSWQTLPARISVARLLLPPGGYRLSAASVRFDSVRAQKTIVENITLKAGDRKFFIIRSVE